MTENGRRLRPFRSPVRPRFVFPERSSTQPSFPQIATRRGFTLMELLLVIVLLGIALGVVVPAFMRSFRGNRLRTAARATAMVARYAHNMSVLKQTDLTLRFDLDTGQINLISAGAGIPGFTRAVEGVGLAFVQIEGHDPCTEGTCEVKFFRNGTCNPFTVKILDPRGEHILLKVDALASVRAMEFGADR